MNSQQQAVPCTAPVTHTPVEKQVIDPDTQRPFWRTTCANCPRWLSDSFFPQSAPTPTH